MRPRRSRIGPASDLRSTCWEARPVREKAVAPGKDTAGLAEVRSATSDHQKPRSLAPYRPLFSSQQSAFLTHTVRQPGGQSPEGATNSVASGSPATPGLKPAHSGQPG